MLSSPRSLGFVLAAVLGAMLVPGCRSEESLSGPSESPPFPTVQFSSTRVIPDEYIVVFRSGVTDPGGKAQTLVAQHGGTLRFTYKSALKGFAAKLPPPALEALKRRTDVAYIEPDQVVDLFETTTASRSWGLDRVDQRALPLDSTYHYGGTGAGVNVYIIDTGIRTTHVEFGGRAVGAFNSVKGKVTTEDCHGHGTHVAGTVGGNTYGIARGVNLYGVRVLDCTGNGTWSGVIAGIDWVTVNRQLPAVANMSLGGSYSQAINDALITSIQSGVTYAIAAGNSATDACSVSPASTPDAITLGASNWRDEQASYSNFGPCVDLYAPGSGIRSAWITSDTSSAIMSGTSMASPHAAGAAALYLADHPLESPASVAAALVASATTGRLLNLGAGSPNLLLYTGTGTQTDPVSTPAPVPCTPKQRWSKNCK